jgi:hypothetical protein
MYQFYILLHHIIKKENSMIKKTKENKSNKSRDFEVKMARLIRDLASRNGLVREEARNRIAGLGKPAIDYLAYLVDHPKDRLRWESVKTLAQIADPDSIPLLLKAMGDDKEGVRWMAVEGLIAIGEPALVPVMEELLCDQKSLRIQNGAHHYLTGMAPVLKRKDIFDLLTVLGEPGPELHTPLIAYRIIRKSRAARARALDCDRATRYRYVKGKAA